MSFLTPLLLAAIGLALRRLFVGYPQPVERLSVLASREASFLVAAAEATFPAG